MKNKQNIIFIYVIICLILTIFNIIKVYPFIPLADGLVRWQMALDIYTNGKIETDKLLSPIIPYIQYFTYSLTQSYALYTVFETFIFYICVGILCNICLKDKEIKIKNINIRCWFIASLILLLMPTIYVFPTMITDSAPVFDIIILMIWLYNSKLNKYLIGTLEFILTFLCVGIRINSLILFGFLIMVALLKIILKKERMKNFIAIIILIGGSLFGIIIPGKLVPNTANASTLGMVWELVGIAKETRDETLITELGQYGNIEEAILRYGAPYLNAIVWDVNPPFNAVQLAREYSKPIIKLYIKTALRIPFSFLKVKIEFMLKTLGVTNKLISSDRGVCWVRGLEVFAEKYGALDNDTQDNMRLDFIKFTDAIGLRPYILMIISLLLCFILKRLNEKTPIKVVLIAIVYYLSFLINTQSFEFRYFAPTFYILLIVIICCIINIIYKIYEKKILKKLPVAHKLKEE